MQKQDSLRLAETAELTGSWTVRADGRACGAWFTDEAVATANGYRVTSDGDCLSAIVPQVAAWRAAPDGIALLDTAGSTMLFFDANGEGRTRDGRIVRLSRDRAGNQP